MISPHPHWPFLPSPWPLRTVESPMMKSVGKPGFAGFRMGGKWLLEGSGPGAWPMAQRTASARRERERAVNADFILLLRVTAPDPGCLRAMARYVQILAA